MKRQTQAASIIVLYSAAIIGISMTSLLLGAIVLGLCTEGLTGLLAAPILMLFGWFYFVPIAVLVSVAILIAMRPFFRSVAGMAIFILSGGMIGSLFMAVFGIKEVGSIARFTIAYAIGGGLSGATSAGLVVISRCLRDDISYQTATATAPPHRPNCNP